MTDLWSTVAAERGALADDLEGLSNEQWQQKSLCQSWTIEQTLAHMTATAHLTPAAFLGAFAKAGFSFDKFATAQIKKHMGAVNTDTLAGFRSIQHSTKSPPGPKASWLGEAIVHAEDIRRPLGIPHTYDSAALLEVADFYQGSNALIGTKSRIAGLALHATDMSWDHGTGEDVAGPMISLLMAMTGRAVACDDLTGAGVEKLRAGGC
ncbi:MAG: hypothetical protein JWQ74_2959 [Marmoricola sp.]|nr:hypothetical protein [Marmoricola sp.]